MTSQKPHPVLWTPASIARFWNLYAARGGMDLWHFSNQRGKALLRLVLRHSAVAEPVLDLGCGSGHLTALLLHKKISCFAADVSSEGIALVQERFARNALFLGARQMDEPDLIPFASASVGTVFLLETIEHLLPLNRDKLFLEIARVLKPSGVLVITTPCNERLERHSLTCLSCGCTFHKTQHISSFNEASVKKIVEKAGYVAQYCRGTLLVPSWRIWCAAQLTPARTTIHCPECGAMCKSPNSNVFTRVVSLINELQHLVCIARKPSISIPDS